MPEQDPFGLKSLGEGPDIPARLTGAQIRLRSRNRRVRRYVAAGLTVVAVLVAGVTLAANLGSSSVPEWATTVSPSADPDTTPDASADPLTSPSAPETESSVQQPQPSWDNVPTLEDLPALDEVTWEVTLEHEEWAQVTLSPCEPDENLQPLTLLIREFVDTTSGEWYLAAATMGFPTTEDATRARQLISESYFTCADHAGEGFADVQVWIEPGEVPVPDELTAASEGLEPVGITGMAVALTFPENPVGLISSATVVQAGSRLTWVASEYSGTDLNCGLVATDVVEQCPIYAIAGDVGVRLAG